MNLERNPKTFLKPTILFIRPACQTIMYLQEYKLENIDVDTKPTGTDSTGTAFGTWGDWIVDTAGLDKTKWKVDGDGIEPIYEVGATPPTSSKGCGKVIEINPNVNNANDPATITFDPDQLNADLNALCIFYRFESKIQKLFKKFKILYYPS